MRQNMKPRLDNPEHLEALASIIGENEARWFSKKCSLYDLTIQEVLSECKNDVFKRYEEYCDPLKFSARETRPECDRGEDGLRRFFRLSGITAKEFQTHVYADPSIDSDHPWVKIAFSWSKELIEQPR